MKDIVMSSSKGPCFAKVKHIYDKKTGICEIRMKIKTQNDDIIGFFEINIEDNKIGDGGVL